MVGGIEAEGIIQLMLDNFLEQEYHSYDKVYVHPETRSGIFIGDFQAAADSLFHQNCNIKTIVTAAVNMDHLAFGESIEHVVYPLLDSKSENIAVLFEKFYEVIEKQARLGSILVHCSAGISRSSTLVISYIMRKEKLSFKEAIALVRKARPKVLPNLGFERQLKKYEELLRKRTSKSERVPRRTQVRTSESGKSDRLIKVDQFRFEEAFPSLQLARDTEKVKRCMEQLTEKGIQVPRAPTGRREQSRNRIILAEKLKKINPVSNQRGVKTELFHPPEDVNIFQFLRVENKRIFKSKTLVSNDPPQLDPFKLRQPLKKHFSEYRKCSLLNNMRPSQKE